MKRLFITLCGVAALTACNKPTGEYAEFAEIPGVEAGDGNNNYNELTRYMDALISEYGNMKYLLELIGQQKEAIDDNLLMERLSDGYIHATDGYLTSATYDRTDEEWTWAYDWVGGRILGSIALNDDDTYCIHCWPGSGCEPDPFEYYLYQRGISGYYISTGAWSYDRETNTLTTHHDGWDFDLTAEVLYFDGEKAVMLGHIAYIAGIGYNSYNNYEGGICHRLELYLIEFPKREKFFERYVSKDEYDALYEAFVIEQEEQAKEEEEEELGEA